MTRGDFFKLQWISLRALSLHSFRSLLREKILYNLFFVAIFLLIMGYFAALLVWGRQDRVILHFGTLVNALAVFGVAIGASTRALRQELEDRTIYPVLVRPVHRSVLYVSKWIGVGVFSMVYTALLASLLALSMMVVGGKPNLAFVQSMGLLWVESTLAGSFALLLALFLRPGLAGMSTLAYLFLGHNHEQMAYLLKKDSATPGLLQGLIHLTPDLSILLMDTRVFYEQALSASELLLRAGYGFGWAFMFVLFGNAVFFRKNL
ncbi:MAG: ABC transporter permease [Bdellovibrionales bacterium]|nr:ABC transporter permease [Bdellovibrionales bacterium]